MSKIIKNTTENDVPIKLMGLTIPGSGVLVIEPAEYRMWVEAAVILEVVPLFSAGTLVMNDGNVDMSATDGLNYLLYPDFAKSQRFDITALPGGKQFTERTTQRAIEESFPRILKDGVPVNSTAREIDFVGSSFQVTNPADNKIQVTQDITILPGKIVDFAFINMGNTSNKWLEFASSSAASDTLPYVSPFDGSLIGLTYMNVRDDTSLDIEIYKNGAPFYTWQIRNKRWAYKTNLTVPQPSLNQGDRISIFSKKVAGDGTPSTPIIEMLFQVSSAPLGEGGGQTGVV